MEFLGTDLIRRSDGRSAFEIPAWVPDGALVHLDFVGNRYWSAERGVVDAADLLDGDVDWWAGYDVPDQLLDIVPGVGLTTGPTTTQFSEHGGPFLNSTTYAEVMAGGGFALVSEVEGSSSSALAGNNAWAFYCTIATYPAWQPNADCWIGMVAAGGSAYFGDNWTTYGTPINPTPPLRLAIDFDVATDKWIGAVNGAAMNALDGVTNVAAANRIGIGASASGQSNSVTATVKFVTFYPRQTQAELKVLSVQQGDVTGPASAADNAIPVFEGISGKRLKDSGVSFSVDTALTANSDANVPTQKAVKAYVDNAVIGLFDFKGSTDCSANPNYPAALKGDSYVVTVGGKIGGASGKSVDAGDLYLATADNAGGTEAAVGASWVVLEHNLQGVMLAANNLSDLTDPAAARTVLNVANGATANTGDVVGPASATDNAIARFDATTGKVIQSSGASITDAGHVRLPVGAGIYVNNGDPAVTLGGPGISGSTGTGIHVGAVNGWVYLGRTDVFGANVLINGPGDVMKLRSTTLFQWSSNATSYGTPDVILARDGPGAMGQRNGDAAQTLNVYGKYASATDYHRLAIKTVKGVASAVSGATVALSGLIPDGALVVGVTSKVTTGLGTGNGTTGYTVGDGTDPDRWGAITGTAAGTSSDNTNATATGVNLFTAANNVVLTASGGNFDGTGVIDVFVHYLIAQAD